MREIKPEDIRVGDLIRWEASDSEQAFEWRVPAMTTEDWPARYRGGRCFLLNRPKPPLELPTDQALGWVDWRTGSGVNKTELTLWDPASGYAVRADRVQVAAKKIHDFTPAVAVPKAALDELREWREALRETNGINAMPTPAVRRIDTFLAAVGAANGADQ